MLVTRKKYNALLAQYNALLSDHAALCEKSQELVKRHVDLRNAIILYFGDDLFTHTVQSEIENAITKHGNVIQVNKWKK